MQSLSAELRWFLGPEETARAAAFGAWFESGRACRLADAATERIATRSIAGLEISA